MGKYSYKTFINLYSLLEWSFIIYFAIFVPYFMFSDLLAFIKIDNCFTFCCSRRGYNYDLFCIQLNLNSLCSFDKSFEIESFVCPVRVKYSKQMPSEYRSVQRMRRVAIKLQKNEVFFIVSSLCLLFYSNAKQNAVEYFPLLIRGGVKTKYLRCHQQTCSLIPIEFVYNTDLQQSIFQFTGTSCPKLQLLCCR